MTTVLDWSVEREGELVRVSLRGELDLGTVEGFQAALLEAEEDAEILVLDLADLEFIDSSGLRTILGAHKRLQQRGARLLLGAAGGAVERVLSVSGIDRHIEAVDDDRPPRPGRRRPWT